MRVTNWLNPVHSKWKSKALHWRRSKTSYDLKQFSQSTKNLHHSPGSSFIPSPHLQINIASARERERVMRGQLKMMTMTGMMIPILLMTNLKKCGQNLHPQHQRVFNVILTLYVALIQRDFDRLINDDAGYLDGNDYACLCMKSSNKCLTAHN